MAQSLWNVLSKRRPLAVCALIALLVLIALGLGTLQLVLSSPAKLPPEERTVVIPRGASLPSIAKLLSEEGLVQSPWRFLLAARLSGVATKLQAGEYKLSTGLSPRELTRLLVEGRTLEVNVTIPEGLTVQDVAKFLEKSGIAQANEVANVAAEPSFISSLGLKAPSLEGYLHPETYRFRKGVGARSALTTMAKATLEIFDNEALVRASALGLTLHEVLTLASIVEKETALPEERPRVAAVFINRLRRSTPLQADPTIIYALGERFNGNLSRSDMNLDSPYNTYLNDGLPPTPIANPSRSSIEAVLRPAEVKDLYFVAKPDGSHHFSATLKDHKRAVRKYQLKRR